MPSIGPDSNVLDISAATRSLQALSNTVKSAPQDYQSVPLDKLIHKEKAIADEILERTKTVPSPAVSLAIESHDDEDLTEVANLIESYLKAIKEYNSNLKSQIKKTQSSSTSRQLAHAARLAMELGAAASAGSSFNNTALMPDEDGRVDNLNQDSLSSPDVINTVNTDIPPFEPDIKDNSSFMPESMMQDRPESMTDTVADSLPLAIDQSRSDVMADPMSVHTAMHKTKVDDKTDNGVKKSKEQRKDGFLQAQALASALFDDNTNTPSQEPLATANLNQGSMLDTKDVQPIQAQQFISDVPSSDHAVNNTGSDNIFAVSQDSAGTVNAALENTAAAKSSIDASNTDKANTEVCADNISAVTLHPDTVDNTPQSLALSASVSTDTIYSAQNTAYTQKAVSRQSVSSSTLTTSADNGTQSIFNLNNYTPRRHKKAAEYIKEQMAVQSVNISGLDFLGQDDEDESFESILQKARQRAENNVASAQKSNQRASQTVVHAPSHVVSQLASQMEQSAMNHTDTTPLSTVVESNKSQEDFVLSYVQEQSGATDSIASLKTDNIEHDSFASHSTQSITSMQTSAQGSVLNTYESTDTSGRDLKKEQSRTDNYTNDAIDLNDGAEDLYPESADTYAADESDDEYYEYLQSTDGFDLDMPSSLSTDDSDNSAAIVDGNPLHVSAAQREIIESSSSHALSFAGKELKTPEDFYYKVKEYDPWYKDIVDAGYQRGPDYALLTESERMVDANDKAHWTLLINAKYSLMTGDPSWLHNITTRFSAFIHSALKIDIKIVDGTPDNCPYNFALNEYLNEISKIRGCIEKSSMQSVLNLLKEDINVLQIDIYKDNKKALT
ncbi:Uncharacterised protein [Anaerobiospirillum thomasii]|uniref:hypothetical protein n=1 Tax=Anaerobiospirillum thomasii TaxID=179995 RepID=UPI000D96A63A|nr:hypothetical protein [Anaerobiospirillum thomasii]SPT68158.1 Uncharacterised protein [Anaerobiospirillum thomasii]